MPRRKSYDRNKAVEKACMVFWQHGYQALGVRELERLTGLNQFAIRSEFGGRKACIWKCSSSTSEMAVTHVLKPLENDGLSGIVSFLNELVREGSSVSSPWGCLIVNTGIENARVCSEPLERVVLAYWARLERFFLTLLGNAQSNGEVAPDVDCGAMAKGLVTAVMGVHAQNRTTQSHGGGRELVDFVCSQLKSLEVEVNDNARF